MAVDSLTWVAHKVGTEGLIRARLLASALGLEVVADEGDKLVLTNERGDIIEYCGPDAEIPAYLFDTQPVVTGYQVSELGAAISQLARQGFEAIGDTKDGPGVRFQHFRGTENEVFALISPNPRVS